MAIHFISLSDCRTTFTNQPFGQDPSGEVCIATTSNKLQCLHVSIEPRKEEGPGHREDSLQTVFGPSKPSDLRSGHLQTGFGSGSRSMNLCAFLPKQRCFKVGDQPWGSTLLLTFSKSLAPGHEDIVLHSLQTMKRQGLGSKCAVGSKSWIPRKTMWQLLSGNVVSNDNLWFIIYVKIDRAKQLPKLTDYIIIYT